MPHIGTEYLLRSYLRAISTLIALLSASAGFPTNLATAMTKRKTNEALSQRTRKRSRSQVTSLYQSRHSSSSPPTLNCPRYSAPPRLQEIPSQSLGPLSIPPRDDPTHEDDDPLLHRILSGIEYVQAQRVKGEDVMQTTRFVLRRRDHLHPGSAMHVLWQAQRAGYATLIASSGSSGVWELGIPRPDWVTEGAFGGMHDPQWFHGKTAAEIKAGPFATQSQASEAAATLQGLATRQRTRTTRTMKQIRIDQKLAEGLRRQEFGVKMYDDDDDDINKDDDYDHYDTEEEEDGRSEEGSTTPETDNYSPSDDSHNDKQSLTGDDRTPRSARPVRTVRNPDHSHGPLSSRQPDFATDSDEYRPSPTSCKIFSDDDEETIKKSKSRPKKATSNPKPMSQTNRQTRSCKEHSSDSEDGLPIKRGVRPRPDDVLAEQTPPAQEESSSNDEGNDQILIKKDGSRYRIRAPSRRYRPIVLESSESE